MGGFASPLAGGTLNVAASNIAKAYTNNDLVCDLLAPRVQMDRQMFQYVVHDRSGMRLEGTDLRAPGATPGLIRSGFSLDTYNCKSRARMAEIPFELEKYGEGFGFSQIAKATQQLIDKIQLGREALLAATVLGAATTVALAGNSMWDNPASTPIEDVTKARAYARQSGVEANLLILGSPVVDALMNNAEIVERLKYTNTTGMVDLDKLSAVLGVKCVRAAAVQVDKNDAVSFVWGQTATLAYVKPVSDQSDLSSCKTFVWTGAPGTVDGYGVITEPKYPLASKATLVSCDMYYDVKITAPETLATFTNCCAAPTYESLAAFANNY